MSRKLLLLLSLGLLSIVCARAEKLTDHYVMQYRENCRLFFIVPFDIPCQDKNMPKASMDITYFTNADSATVNMTISSPEPLKAEKISFVTSECGYDAPSFQTFYVEKGEKYWQHRYSCRVPYSFIKEMFGPKNPFLMEIKTDGQSFRYMLPQRKWAANPYLYQIVLLIESNRNL